MYRHHVFSLTTVLLVAANLLIPVAILVFAVGFFPYKPFLPGLAEYHSFGYGSLPEAPFDRLIFMVIDALRRSVSYSRRPLMPCSYSTNLTSDFVYLEGSGFEFTQRSDPAVSRVCTRR